MNFSTEQQLNQLINNYNQKNEFENDSESSMILDGDINELDNFEKRLNKQKSTAKSDRFKLPNPSDILTSINIPIERKNESFRIKENNQQNLQIGFTNEADSESFFQKTKKNSKFEVTIHEPNLDLKNEIKREQETNLFKKKKAEIDNQIIHLEKNTIKNLDKSINILKEHQQLEGRVNVSTNIRTNG
jgi:hypothetical protein